MRGYFVEVLRGTLYGADICMHLPVSKRKYLNWVMPVWPSRRVTTSMFSTYLYHYVARRSTCLTVGRCGDV